MSATLRKRPSPKSKLTCKDCGTGIMPPGRLGTDGQPMTRKQLIALFVEPKGGRCTECYLAHNKKETSELMARHRADPTIRTRPWPDFGGFWKPQPQTPTT